MQTRPLGRTGIDVSLIALGTMTWGEQNTEADAHSQLDLALESGINLIDAAEMYPVPPRPETQGRTEQYIGTWVSKAGRRDRVVLATKAAGPARKPHNPRHIRGGDCFFDRKNLEAALHDSLKRLRTDYVDLYQLHWPDRSTNTFGQLGYVHVKDEVTTPIDETLRVLEDFIKAGKVRAIGVSNETPWGLSRFVQYAETLGLPRVASIQNPYNLLNRSFEIGLSEIALREDVGLLAYSPLAFGVLSGKYLAGARPAGARVTLFERFQRYTNENAEAATYEYVKLAHKHGIDPVHLALGFVNTRDFLTSNIIGATTLAQLRQNIASAAVTLPAEVLAGIDAIHRRYPNPAP
ncbi:NADP(H)-dependent aldo-keto reductase [Niveibacterium sp. SC-1]|uniref:NADP(H)-dependent aldo-keto reductase n=1 Tax=Niveibacterium sp. SC-1 TaxID=3135646 RepID=UPI00311D570A